MQLPFSKSVVKAVSSERLARFVCSLGSAKRCCCVGVVGPVAVMCVDITSQVFHGNFLARV